MNAPLRTAPGWLPVALSLLACSFAAFWVADGVAPWNAEQSNVWHHYEYMTEGFLAGHLYLSVEPPPELLALKDPYDPATNARYRLWDASLYHGKYYLYYGPAPAIVLMVPWRLLTGHMLPQRLAVAVFAVGGLAGLALLLLEVRRSCFPRLSGTMLGLVLVVAFHAAWLPVILRRPGFWEMPIVSATAFLWWALYFLWKYRDSGRGSWAVATGLALMLMIGCRVTNVFEAGVILLLLAPFADAGRPRKWGAACAAAGIVAAGGVALLLYNHARFGRWLDFGQSHMLWGMDYRGAGWFDPSYIPFNMWTYLMAMPDLGPYFPFVHASWPASFPAGYLGTEAMFGARFAMPVHLVGLLGLAWAWRRRAAPATRGSALVLGAAACSSLLAGCVLFCFKGQCSRYIAELFAGWTLVTSVGLMAVFGSEGAERFPRWARLLCAGVACWTFACVWLASAEFRGFMRQTNPGTYRALAHALDYPSEWWLREKAIRFAPIDIVVRVPPSAPFSRTILVASGYPEKVNQLALARVDSGHVRLILNGNEDSVLETGPLETPSGVLRVRLSAPWLYPPPEHPYWDRYADASRRLELQTLFSLALGSAEYSAHSTHSFDASGFVPAVLGARDSGPGSPFVESVSLAATGP